MRRIPFLVLFLFLFAQTSPAKTLYVSKSGDGSDGFSWETGFNTVTEAIDLATAGDEIWVASGIYRETLDLIPGITLIGGFNGSEVSSEERDLTRTETLVGEPADNPYGSSLDRTVIFAADNTRIDGFTIEGGNGDDDHGGGIHIEGISSVRFCSCWIRRNYSDSLGGGVYIRDSTDVTISNCIVSANRTLHAGGGMIMLRASHVSISNTLFFGNTAGGPGGIIPNTSHGADIVARDSDLLVSNCSIGRGGSISGNGTDLSVLRGNTRVVNCIVDGSSVELDPVLTHCNLYPNPAGLFVDGGGNFSKEPSFRGRLEGAPLGFDPMNYSLRSDSPCIDSGTTVMLTNDLANMPRPIDVVGTGVEGEGAFDVGCYEFQLRKSDMNQDGKVDAVDLLMFQEEWMREGGQ